MITSKPKARSSNALYPEPHRQRVVPIEDKDSPPEPYRSCWRRDYARLIHSAAFRRLQGKTQLFPGRESDFFRNRLTHSLEVAQIAKSIALRFNFEHEYFRKNPIDTDLIETAALAHDLGHPPFGHNGEEALDECMRDAGGFEGNAQTLRILTKLEKRDATVKLDDLIEPVIDGKDMRAGLNLTFRTLAAVLKYDRKIPSRRNKPGVEKGYYYTEKDVVDKIKQYLAIAPGTRLRTVECGIMDVADDIAYSTYDLEDAFKAGFLSPAKMLAIDDALATKVADVVRERLQKAYPGILKKERSFEPDDVYFTIATTFADVFDQGVGILEEVQAKQWDPRLAVSVIASDATSASANLAKNGYYRSKLTSDFVGTYIRSVRLEFNSHAPMLSKVQLDIETFKRVEVMKNYAFQALIMSPMLKVAEHRGKDIVRQIFNALNEDEGYLLMPSDFQGLYEKLEDPAEKKRAVCDFIAGMTDRYAVQFYGRLFGTNPETIFSPL